MATVRDLKSILDGFPEDATVLLGVGETLEFGGEYFVVAGVAVLSLDKRSDVVIVRASTNRPNPYVSINALTAGWSPPTK